MTIRGFSWLRQGRQARLAQPTAPTTLAQYNTHDARNVFSHLLRRVRRGETIVIAHAGRPVAKLVPYQDPEMTRPGFLTGRRGNYEIVEILGLYWHFVDLVWVFIFAFFYLW